MGNPTPPTCCKWRCPELSNILYCEKNHPGSFSSLLMPLSENIRYFWTGSMSLLLPATCTAFQNSRDVSSYQFTTTLPTLPVGPLLWVKMRCFWREQINEHGETFVRSSDISVTIEPLKGNGTLSDILYSSCVTFKAFGMSFAGSLCLRERQDPCACASRLLLMHGLQCHWHSFLYHGAHGWSHFCESHATGT